MSSLNPGVKASAAGVATRAQAARALERVISVGRPLDVAVAQAKPYVPPRERPLLQALCYGVMRRYHELLACMTRLSDRRLKEIAPKPRALILLGLYQLRHTRIPDHAAIHATVEAAAALDSDGSRGFINAILRKHQRLAAQGDAAEQLVADDPAARYAHPLWMLEQWQQDWPHDWQSIVAANNAHPPMTLRLDTGNIPRDEYLGLLAAKGLAASGHAQVATAITLAKPTEVEALPGFAQGLVSVQDAAAQLAAPLLQVESSHRALDACAAPGGKTAHILQHAQPAELLALDNDEWRLKKLRHTLRRVRREAEVVCADACEPKQWWDGRPFDRVLLDAPCSAAGVIRRRPDIKCLRTPAALAQAVTRQAEMLEALWPTLGRGGRLVYATCSVFKQENEAQISRFLERHADARIAAPNLPDGCGRGTIGRQILPGEHDMDGFYFAVLVKED